MADKDEENVQLRINIAVLENDLKHKTQEAEDQAKGMAIFFRALGSRFPALTNALLTPAATQEGMLVKAGETNGGELTIGGDMQAGKKIMKLEMEVDVLRRENRILRGQEREKRLAAELDFDRRVFGTEEYRLITTPKEAVPELHKIQEGNEVINPTTPKEQTQIVVHEEKYQQSVSDYEEYQQEDSLEDSFKDFHQDLTNEYIEEGVFHGGCETTEQLETYIRDLQTWVNNRHRPTKATNVGMFSLEESFDLIDKHYVDENKVAKVVIEDSGKLQVAASPARSLPSEDEKKSYNPLPKELGNGQNARALHRFMNFPAPTVLKTGFDAAQAVTGGDYDSLKDTQAIEGRPPPFFRDKIASGNIWESREEKTSALVTQRLMAGDRDRRVSVDFFKHGIQFVPAQPENKHQETVLIGNLPHNIELRDILNRVRGGKIVSAILLDTKPLTGKMSALVRFVYETSAAQYISYVKENPIYFGEDDTKLQAEIILLPTPSYPLNFGLTNAIFNLSHTRCIAIPYFPQISISFFETSLSSTTFRQCATPPTEMWLDEDRTMHLEFASVSDAGMARGKLYNWAPFRGLEIRSDADPCAGPVEELALEVEARKPLFPRGGFVDGTTFGGQDFEKKVAEDYSLKDIRTTGYGVETKNIDLASSLANILANSSWADEVNDQNATTEIPLLSISDEESTAKPAHPLPLQSNNTNLKPLKGLATSIYAPNPSPLDYSHKLNHSPPRTPAPPKDELNGSKTPFGTDGQTSPLENEISPLQQSMRKLSEEAVVQKKLLRTTPPRKHSPQNTGTSRSGPGGNGMKLGVKERIKLFDQPSAGVNPDELVLD
ncbi:hypothetical protein M7I_2001 [Glarea lozoyensis 74030]|nr:hypothetical protein M7I_2001 [Glarea lozoyensis 74030]